MRNQIARKGKWSADFDADNDPSCASDLLEDQLTPRRPPSNRETNPNSAWALARTFSDLLRARTILICGLDLQQTQRFAAHVSTLMNECGLSPDQIRQMFDCYAAKAQTRQIKSHVGYFWCLREELAREVTRLQPVITDPPVWTQEQARIAAPEWSW